MRINVLNFILVSGTVAHSKTGDILYKAQSQDEDALVQAAAQLHMILFNKSGNILGTFYLLFLLETQLKLATWAHILTFFNISEVKFNTTILQYEVLEILEFTSDRKRMSVVLKDCQNGKILLLSKGADEAILPYARAGLFVFFFSFLFFFA